MDLFAELEWRGLVHSATEGAKELLAGEKVTGYIGFDPTASSLHVGNLQVIMPLIRMQRFGHRPIAVVGGGTGLIGDPSGKTVERQLLTVKEVDANVDAIRRQLARFLDFESSTAPARLVNNAEWLTTLSAVDFMRDVGKHFSVSGMLAKESVRRRIESEEGITYTEFSYSLLQAYDYLELFDRFGCTLQMGGSDQWGNITAGMDLIRRVRGGKAHGLVLPLVATATGAKFGKTEAGAVWLDPDQTSPYQFYQFWLNTDDRDAVKYLKFFTFLDARRIRELEEAGQREPERRHPQRELAREVTRLVHGEGALRDAEQAAGKLFGGDVAAMTAAELRAVYADVPSIMIKREDSGWRVSELLVKAGLVSSNGEAVRLVRGGGVAVNGRRITDERARLMPADAIDNELFLIRKGKREYALARIGETPRADGVDSAGPDP